MSLSTRPGSLTLLAGINLVGGGVSVLACIAAVVGLSLRAHGFGHHGPPRWAETPLWAAWLDVGWCAVRTALLVISGIGLRRQSPLMGRWVANLYAFLAILMAGIWMWLLPDQSNRVMMSLVVVYHALILLLWVNIVVRDVWLPAAAVNEDMSVRAPHPAERPSGHVWLNLRMALRQTMRGTSGPAFLLGYVSSGLLVVLIVVSLAGTAEKLHGKLLGDGTPKAVPGTLIEAGTRWVIRTVLQEEPVPMNAPEPSSAQWARYLVHDHSALTSFTWLVFSALAAIGSAAASFNLISRDNAQHGFRFLLVRTHRNDIYIGRLLSAALLTVLATLALVVVASAALGLAQPEFEWRPHLIWTAWAAFALVLTTLPYVALGLWFSTMAEAGLAVLALVYAVVIGLPILALVVSAQLWQPLIYLAHLIPAGVQFWLFHPSPWSAWGAAAACLAYTAIFVTLGMRRFRAMDL